MLQVLHLVRAQCGSSSLVTIVKLIERSFSDGFTVRFEMYDAAPASPPAPLPYFIKTDGSVLSDEIELGKYLSSGVVPSLLEGDATAMDSLLAESGTLTKPVKAATKSKTAEVFSPLGACCACRSPPSSTQLDCLQQRYELRSVLSGLRILPPIVCCLQGEITDMAVPCQGHCGWAAAQVSIQERRFQMNVKRSGSCARLLIHMQLPYKAYCSIYV